MTTQQLIQFDEDLKKHIEQAENPSDRKMFIQLRHKLLYDYCKANGLLKDEPPPKQARTEEKQINLVSKEAIEKNQRQQRFDKLRAKAVSKFLKGIEYHRVVDTQNYLLEIYLRTAESKENTDEYRNELIFNHSMVMNFLARIQYLVRYDLD